jgi:hypothetical protein
LCWCLSWKGCVAFFNGSLSSNNEVVIQIIGALKAESAHVMQCQIWIKEIACCTGALPDTFVLTGVTQTSASPVSGGGLVDIYRGQYKGKEVALEVLRVFVTHKTESEVFRVRSFFTHCHLMT